MRRRGDESLWGVEDEGDYWREEAASMVNAMHLSEIARRKAARIAAADDGEAAKVAADWQIRDRLLKVQPVRVLQPQLTLTGGGK